MSYFKVKVHKIWLGLRPDPAWPLGELTALPDPLYSWISWVSFQAEGGKGKIEEGEGE